MAVKNLENLVLRGVTVACGVVTGLKRIGSNTANERMPALDLSHSRHPSQSDPQAVSDSRSWYYPAEPLGAGTATERAGRPGCCPGVLASQSPAIAAGRAVLFGWSLAGDPRPMGARCFGRFTTGQPAPVDQGLRQRFQPLQMRTLPPNGLIGRLAVAWPGKHPQAATTWFRPSGETLTARALGTRGGNVGF